MGMGYPVYVKLQPFSELRGRIMQSDKCGRDKLTSRNYIYLLSTGQAACGCLNVTLGLYVAAVIRSVSLSGNDSVKLGCSKRLGSLLRINSSMEATCTFLNKNRQGKIFQATYQLISRW